MHTAQEHEMKVITRARDNKNGIPMIRTPQFPGVTGKDLSIAQVRSIIRRQKRAKGFTFNLVTGDNKALKITLSGTARTFLGFSILLSNDTGGAQATEMTITVNNEIVIQKVRPAFFSPDFMDDEYYFFLRPLSGQDDILLDVTVDTGTIDFSLIAYYI